ncbi:VPS16 protein, partial [Tyrannus savana]|nr:VPS16 protein [Tyrannus savana]
EVLQNHVLEAQVFHTEFGTGVAILTGAFRFSLATNIDDLKLRRLPEVPGLQQPPACWAVLSQDRVTVVLLAVGPELFLLDNTSCSSVVREWECGNGGAAGPVPVSRSFLCPHCPMGCSQPPRSVAGPSLVCPVPGDAPRSFPCPTGCSHPSTLSPRSSLPLAASQVCLIPIPTEASQEIFRIASMAPGALLLEAQKEYEKESQKADEYLREIREQQLLPEAVGQCIEAAGYEHEPHTQKSLLRAASFGKCFLDKFPPESFVRMCQDLRVLNAIRDYQIGIPLTFTQYPQLQGLEGLVLRRLYPLAIRICEFLRLPEIQGVSRILAHWACSKVRGLCQGGPAGGGGPGAHLGEGDSGDRGTPSGPPLPPQLLEYEPRSGEQVPLLLKMKRSKLALGKAIESGDTD